MSPQPAEKRTLRLEGSGREFYEFPDRPAPDHQLKATLLAREGGPKSCAARLCRLTRSTCVRNEVQSQVLSLLVASMSMSAASLEDRGVSLPCLVNFHNYAFIFAILS